ncbi:MAG: hypothetical protein ACI4RP_05895 [Acutalibacteraceae bacterium]
MRKIMKYVKKYSVLICVIAAAAVLLVSFASYLFAGTEIRTMLAQASCVLAVVGIAIGLLTFDEKD